MFLCNLKDVKSAIHLKTLSLTKLHEIKPSVHFTKLLI